jgi:hypothetical protein
MTKRPRPQSQRPPQFSRRPPLREPAPDAELDDCGWGSRRQVPCGACDRCEYESAAYGHDHPATLSVEELAHL